jgi:non-specific serine/threonine protein kinase
MFLALINNQPLPPGIQEKTLQAARATGNQWALALALSNVGRVASMSGNLDEAYTRFVEAAALFQQIRDRAMYNGTHSEIGHVYRKQGHYPEALTVYRQTIHAWQELGQYAAVAHELECFAFIAGASGQNERTAKLFGAAEALRQSINSSMTPMERPEYDQAVAQLREQMGEATFKSTWEQGRTLTMETAIQFALEDTGE